MLDFLAQLTTILTTNHWKEKRKKHLKSIDFTRICARKK